MTTKSTTDKNNIFYVQFSTCSWMFLSSKTLHWFMLFGTVAEETRDSLPWGWYLKSLAQYSSLLVVKCSFRLHAKSIRVYWQFFPMIENYKSEQYLIVLKSIRIWYFHFFADAWNHSFPIWQPNSNGQKLSELNKHLRIKSRYESHIFYISFSLYERMQTIVAAQRQLDIQSSGRLPFQGNWSKIRGSQN